MDNLWFGICHARKGRTGQPRVLAAENVNSPHNLPPKPITRWAGVPCRNQEIDRIQSSGVRLRSPLLCLQFIIESVVPLPCPPVSATLLQDLQLKGRAIDDVNLDVFSPKTESKVPPEGGTSWLAKRSGGDLGGQNGGRTGFWRERLASSTVAAAKTNPIQPFLT